MPECITMIHSPVVMMMKTMMMMMMMMQYLIIPTDIISEFHPEPVQTTPEPPDRREGARGLIGTERPYRLA